MRALIFLFVCSAASLTYGDSLEAKAYRVITGDLFVAQEGKVRHLVRLAGIKAPVAGQPFHESSSASLKKLIDKKVLKIEWDKVEEYCKAKRDKCPKVGRVIDVGKDISLEQVRLGMAWHDVRHVDEQTTPDRTLYSEAEEHARAKRLGLWKQKKPIAPWRFTGKPASPAAAPPGPKSWFKF